MKLEKYSIGVGDRFGRQGVAQLRALQAAEAAGTAVTPVWNKSAREHAIIGSTPADTRRAAEAAVKAAGWTRPWHVDADHIGLATVEGFIVACDFYTIDVADFIGRPPAPELSRAFLDRAGRYLGKRLLPDSKPVTREFLDGCAGQYLEAMAEAGRVYRRIAGLRGEREFIVEVSLDEALAAQTPDELFFILAAAALEKIPLQTIAPKWSGRFNKGVDYSGDPERFRTEFAAALETVELAVMEFGLPENLKLSLHSGSDKFSIYPAIRETLGETGAGLHLKTAGTTWLEEAAGLAEAGGDGWEFMRELYGRALERSDEVCRPYIPVLDIDRRSLPMPADVNGWSGADFARVLTHDQGEKSYHPHLRQLIHVSYGLAAESGKRFYDLLDANAALIGRRVTENLFNRHVAAVFPAEGRA
jgi:tagaturonate epimerase